MSDINGAHARILILAEAEGQGIALTTRELLAIGKKIASDLRGILTVAIIGHGIADAAKELAKFSRQVYSIDHPQLAHFGPEHYASALERLCRQINPDVVLMASTIHNFDLAARLSHRMGVHVITDCLRLAVDVESGHLLCTKPVYGGKINSVFRLVKKPYLATVRPKTTEPLEDLTEDESGDIVGVAAEIDESLVKIRMVEKVKEEGASLDKAEAIVAGGRGIRDAEGVEKLKTLVNALRKYFGKAVLGASRALVDTHLVPSSLQIGLTGEKVAPQIYVAVAISGSLQHLTGILGAKKIIAINKDPEAYIFKAADYGIIGDFEEVVPAITKALETLP